MSAYRSHRLEDVCRRIKPLPKNHRRQKLTQRGPGSVRPFVAVKRSFAGGAFAPTFGAIAVGDTSQDNATFSGATEAGFEEMDEGQAYFPQFDRLDDQGVKMAPP